MAACPDDSLWSSYIDGEVGEPWRSRMRDHLSRCPRCSSKVQALDSLHTAIGRISAGSEQKAIASASARIKACLDAESLEAPIVRRDKKSKLVDIMGWKVSLPIPALAAALVAIVLLFGYSLGAFTPLLRNARLLASLSKVLASNQTDLETLAQTMRQASAQAVVIEAPSGYVFDQPGNPEIFAIDALYNGSSTTLAGASR